MTEVPIYPAFQRKPKYEDGFHQQKYEEKQTETAELPSEKLVTRKEILEALPAYFSEAPCPCPPGTPGAKLGRGEITILDPQPTPRRRTANTIQDILEGSLPDLSSEELLAVWNFGGGSAVDQLGRN